MKFLIYGNAPNVNTGYGVQVRYLADKLTLAGHDVAVASTYGHQYGVGSWTTPHGHKVTLYPNGMFGNSADPVRTNSGATSWFLHHALHFFDGNPDAGWIITLTDQWVLLPCAAELREWNVLAWTPVDHFPVPPEVGAFLEQSGAIPVAMSRYGEQQLVQVGQDAAFVPLCVDTDVFRPTFEINHQGGQLPDGAVNAREAFNVPDGAFVVGMVAMNKDPFDRKGFNEALRAFGQFWQNHQNAVLLIHTDRSGLASGINLDTLAAHAAVPEHALIFTEQYPYRLGLSQHWMAGLYTCMDVLLCTSHGEGFGVPLIEAQACGTPVIAPNSTATAELVGPGWAVHGQPWWDQSQSSSYVVPLISDVTAKLEQAYLELSEDAIGIAKDCIEFAEQYSVNAVWEAHWQPLIDQISPPPPEPAPPLDSVDVIVPLMRPKNLDRLLRSIAATAPGWGSLTEEPAVRVLVIHDTDCAVPLLKHDPVLVRYLSTGTESTSYADKVNQAVAESDRPWVLVVGDDVEFTPGWFDNAVEDSRWADVVGTNDSEPGRIRNVDVAAGRHADHFFIRRSYIDNDGSSLDGPGVAMPTVYRHWFVDREVIQLAKARGRYRHAAESRIIHHHPGYDGDEKAREADKVYMTAVEHSDDDHKTWLRRAPLIEQHRVAR